MGRKKREEIVDGSKSGRRFLEYKSKRFFYETQVEKRQAMRRIAAYKVLLGESNDNNN